MSSRELQILSDDALLAAIIRDETHAARRHQTIEDVEHSERLVEAAKAALAARHAIGKVGREGLPDQG